MSGSYYGSNSSGACDVATPRSIAGSEPTAVGKFPVFVFLTGTTMPFNGTEAQALTNAMAERGFVAATVEYDNAQYPACTAMRAKAGCIWNAVSANSAISKLCARDKADCANKGIVVSGFSQGANLAALSKNYDARVRAAFLIGHGNVASGLIDVRSCANDSATTLLPSEMRSVNGDSDQFFGFTASGVKSQLQAVVGVSCSSASTCLQADGSGWYIISSSQLSDRKADHCYYFNGANSTCSTFNGLDSGWNTGTSPWSMQPNLDWLASRATL